jgi:hypothetical protein
MQGQAGVSAEAGLSMRCLNEWQIAALGALSVLQAVQKGVFIKNN